MEAERWSRCRFGSMRRSFCCGCFRLLLLLPVVAAGCCLFLLFVLRSLACTHNDRDEWIVFCCWHFNGRAGSLTFLSHTIQNVSKNCPSVFPSVSLSVCLLFTSSVFWFGCFDSDPLGQTDNTRLISLKGPDEELGSNHQQTTTRNQSKRTIH